MKKQDTAKIDIGKVTEDPVWAIELIGKEVIKRLSKEYFGHVTFRVNFRGGQIVNVNVGDEQSHMPPKGKKNEKSLSEQGHVVSGHGD